MMLKLTLILMSLSTVAHGGKCGERQFPHNGLCCNMCRPGEYVKRNCSASNDTSCKPCEIGTTMRQYNQASKCDTCRHHQYFDINLSFCMDCRACPKGQYPVNKCEKLENTRCLECPKGHYSNITKNFNSTCVPCTICNKYFETCTAEKDAVCMDDKERPGTTKVPTVHQTVDSERWTVQNSTLETTIPVKKEVDSSSESHDSTVLILAIVVPTSFLLLFIFIYLFAMSKIKTRCKEGKKFQILSRNIKCEPLRTGLLLRDQQPMLMLKLVELLTAEGRPNWKDLAINFNDFTRNEIDNFAVDKTNATERMLSSWQTRNTSTVDKLHRCLANIKRYDVATYVADFVNGAITSV